MTADERRLSETDRNHPAYDHFTRDVDHDLWSRISEGARVIGPTGEQLGRVRSRQEMFFTVDAPKNVFETEELYVPHVAVDRVEGGAVHLGWAKAQLIEVYDHYRQQHYPPGAQWPEDQGPLPRRATAEAKPSAPGGPPATPSAENARESTTAGPDTSTVAGGVEAERAPDAGDPDHWLHEYIAARGQPVLLPDLELWSRVHTGQQVLGPSGERLGVVRVKSDLVVEVESRKSAFETEELYVPHIAFERVEGEQIHLRWERAQVSDAYDHARRYHFPRFS